MVTSVIMHTSIAWFSQMSCKSAPCRFCFPHPQWFYLNFNLWLWHSSAQWWIVKKTETITKLWVTTLWLTELWPPTQWLPVHLRVWHLPSTPSAGYFVSTWVYNQLECSPTLMIQSLSVTTQTHQDNSYQMKHKHIKSHFLPYNLHLIQLGNMHNIKKHLIQMDSYTFG